MATVRRLKKEITWTASHLINDCIDYIEAFGEKNGMNVFAIIEETVSLNNSMIDRANNPDGKKNPKLVKAHYRKLKADFIAGIVQGYDKLEKAIKE